MLALQGAGDRLAHLLSCHKGSRASQATGPAKGVFVTMEIQVGLAVGKRSCGAGGHPLRPGPSAGQTGVMGDPEGLEEGVTSSRACTLPGTVMENDGDILQGIALLHICSGARVGGERQPLSPSAVQSSVSHRPLARPQTALGCPQEEQNHLPGMPICFFRN